MSSIHPESTISRPGKLQNCMIDGQDLFANKMCWFMCTVSNIISKRSQTAIRAGMDTVRQKLASCACKVMMDYFDCRIGNILI